VEAAAEAGRERGVTQKSGLIIPTRAVRTFTVRVRREAAIWREWVGWGGCEGRRVVGVREVGSGW
jgi:hypothetical protein